MNDREFERRAARAIDLAALPELPTRIGMAGAMRHAEVGGAACIDSGILVAIIVSGIDDR